MQEIEFLGLKINSVTLELPLNKTKIHKVASECQNLLNNPQTLILDLTRLIGLLTIQAVSPARLNCRFLQIEHISSLLEKLSYLEKIVFERKLKIRTEMAGTKLRTVQWSGINSIACRGVNIVRCLSKGLGGNLQWNLIRGRYSLLRK